MTRSEDNWKLINEFTKRKNNVSGVAESIASEMIYQTAFLMDISRSLAIIADKLSTNEVKEEGEKNV